MLKKSNFLLKYSEMEVSENLEKDPSKCMFTVKLIIGKTAVSSLAVGVSIGSLVRTLAITKSTRMFLQKTENGNQFFLKKTQ